MIGKSLKYNKNQYGDRPLLLLASLSLELTNLNIIPLLLKLILFRGLDRL